MIAHVTQKLAASHMERPPAERRLQAVAHHLGSSTAPPPLPLPIFLPGVHTVAGFNTRIPALCGTPLDNGASTEAALACPNRGPLRLMPDGRPDPGILAAFETYGFYVLTGVLRGPELAELQADVERIVDFAETVGSAAAAGAEPPEPPPDAPPVRN